MNNHLKSKRNGGFTLVETLATVAIIVILLAVSAVPVAEHRDTLKLIELDNAAREIYMAAENRAVLLAGNRQLGDVMTKLSKTIPVELSSVDAKHDDEENYYVSKADLEKLKDPEDMADPTAELLTTGSIDPTLWDGDFYIVYDLKSGSVTDVFYAEKEETLGDLIGEDFQDFYKNWARNRDDRKKEDNSGNKVLVGWYYGKAADGSERSPETPQNPYIDVEIDNGEELILTVTVKGEYAEYIKDNPSKLDVKLGSIDDDEFEVHSITLNTTGITDFATGHKWTLDSLKGPHFKEYGLQEKGGFQLGDDFKVVATITTGNGEKFSAEDEDNSLFWTDGEYNRNIENYDKTAYIKYLRHLQNLSANDASGYNSGASEKKTAAIQVADIKAEYKGSAYNFIPIVNEKLISYNGVNKTINDLTIDRSGDNSALFGKNFDICTIENVTLKGGSIAGDSNVGGIVGENSGTVSNCVIKTMESTSGEEPVVKGSVTGNSYVGGIVGDNKGTVEKCSYEGTLTGTNSVGGYVGQNSGTVEGCDRSDTNQIEITVTGTNPQNIGGIVGLCESGTIKECKNLALIDVSAADNVGGIVGALDTRTSGKTATVESCYNGIDRQNDSAIISGKSNVGGLVGYSKGTTTAMILSSNNYADVTGSASGNYVGGLVGYNGGLVGINAENEPKTCVNKGNVSGGTDVGGVAGYSEGTVDGKNTLIGGITVSGKQNVGGFVGSNTGTVQNCERPTTDNTITVDITGTGTNIGGIVGQSGTGEGDNSNVKIILCENHAALNYPACSNVGGIVGDNYGLVGTTSKAEKGSTATACVNTGNVTGNQNVGGIVGRNVGGVVDGCNSEANSGTISGKTQVGGFVGGMSTSGIVRNCVRKNTTDTNGKPDTVTGDSYVGGIVGLVWIGEINECINEGPVSATATNSYAGGIVGGLNSTGTVEDCHNTILDGVNISGKNYVGGIAGNVGNSSTVNRCYNGDDDLTHDATEAGNIFGTVKGMYYVGGIGGQIVSSTVSNSYNKANVEADNNYAGGLVGVSNGGAIRNSYNAGNVKGNDYVGGILGLSTKTATTIDTNYVDGSSALPSYGTNLGSKAQLHQQLVYTTNPNATHYGSILGSCEFTLVGMSDKLEGRYFTELRQGRIAGTDSGAPTGGIKVTNTSNNYYYRSDYTLFGNHTATDAPIAGASMTRSFYRNNTGGADSGNGARLPSTLFNYDAVKSMNEYGKTDLWIWTGSKEDGRPVLAGIGEGAYVMWLPTKMSDFPSITADVFDTAPTATYTATVTLRDGVPAGGTWAAVSDTVNTGNKIITKVVNNDSSGKTYNLSITVDNSKLPNAKQEVKDEQFTGNYILPDDTAEVIKYTVNGKTYYGSILIKFEHNVKLQIQGGTLKGYVYSGGTPQKVTLEPVDRNGKVLTGGTVERTFATGDATVGIYADADGCNKNQIRLSGNWQGSYTSVALTVNYTFTYKNYKVTVTGEKINIYKNSIPASALPNSQPVDAISDDDPADLPPDEIEIPGPEVSESPDSEGPDEEEPDNESPDPENPAPEEPSTSNGDANPEAEPET